MPNCLDVGQEVPHGGFVVTDDLHVAILVEHEGEPDNVLSLTSQVSTLSFNRHCQKHACLSIDTH